MKPICPSGCLIHIVALTVALGVLGRSSAGADSVDFDRDIKPVLATKCFRCHGADKQESGFRFDVRRRALLGGDGGVAIVPGKSGESELIRRVVSTDDADRMPPEGERLTDAEVDLLRGWIDLGAKGMPENDANDAAQRHWAFRPIRRPASPAVSDIAWARNAIDRFVRSKLEEQGIAPSPAAPDIDSSLVSRFDRLAATLGTRCRVCRGRSARRLRTARQ